MYSQMYICIHIYLLEKCIFKELCIVKYIRIDLNNIHHIFIKNNENKIEK